MTVAHDVGIPPFAQKLQRFETYAEINEIMRSTEFRQGGAPERFLFLGDTVMLLDGEEHLQRKALLSAIFTRDAMVAYETQLLDPQIEQVMAELQATRGADGLARADFVPLVRAMLLRIAAKVTGIDGVDTPERTERFHHLVATMSESVSGQWTTRPVEEVVRDGKATLEILVDEFMQASLSRRQALVLQFRSGELAKEDLPRDAFTLMCLHDLDTASRDGDSRYFSYVWREAALFLTASTATTTISLPHVVIHLSEWLKAHPEDARQLQDAAFLRMAVGESLRLHQTAPLKLRIANQDVSLSTGRQVAKDEMVALYAPAANLEPGVFGPDAHAFNPYRKTPAGMQPWGMTFGAGVHMCLGRSLVTGVYNKPKDSGGTEGTMVKILKIFYGKGLELDPQNPPKRVSISRHDAYESVPIILRNL